MYAKLCRELWIALGSLKRDERGLAALEYAILAAVILVALVAALSGTNVTDLFNKFAGALTNANTIGS